MMYGECVFAYFYGFLYHFVLIAIWLWEHLHGVDASGVIYCCLLLRRYSQKLELQEATHKGQKLRPKAKNKGELLG